MSNPPGSVSSQRVARAFAGGEWARLSGSSIVGTHSFLSAEPLLMNPRANADSSVAVRIGRSANRPFLPMFRLPAMRTETFMTVKTSLVDATNIGSML